MSDPAVLSSFGGVPALAFAPNGAVTTQWSFGWVDDPVETARVARGLAIASASDTPAGQLSAAELPKSVYQWELYKKATGGKAPPVKNQGRVGSCVAFGTCAAVVRMMAIEKATSGPVLDVNDIAEEVVYGGSRYEVGGGRLGAQDGSIGAWAAKFVKEWGVIARGTYGTHDLGAYSEDRCRQYGYYGVPDDLEPKAREHPVQDTVLVNSWAEAKRMLASGYGIAVCSNQGFSLERGANGVAAAEGSWAHCMCLDGYHTEGTAEYAHITNSWGANTHTGPVGWGNPGTDGFWARADVVGRMLGQGDSWAFARLKGFPAKTIDWGTGSGVS